MGDPTVDITIPVLNEEKAILGSLRTLSGYLTEQCAYDWTITVVDNGSSDGTFALAHSMAEANPRVSVLRLEEGSRPSAQAVLAGQQSRRRCVHGCRSVHRPRIAGTTR